MMASTSAPASRQREPTMSRCDELVPLRTPVALTPLPTGIFFIAAC